ncbi:MAG TPA: hypothetical protein VG457_15895 [Planctomycetota bacterium]|nr:hypothetical protein [Planctomycetota bacterium]
MNEFEDSSGAESKNFRAGFSETLRLLREDAHELGRGRWEEAICSRMRSHAKSLAGFSKTVGRKDLATILKTLASLLDLPPEEALPIRAEVSGKVGELLGMLDDLV